MGNFKACLPHIIAFVLAGGVFTAGVELLTNDIREPKELVTDAPEDNTSPIDDNIIAVHDNYHTYIDLIAKKISEVKEERDIIGDFAIYEAILKNGYISYGDFEYAHPSVGFICLRGASVAVGNGVCLNEAHNMADVFTSLGYDARVVLGNYYNKEEKNEKGPNHALVYIDDGEFSYLLDPTNEQVFLKESFMKYYSTDSQEDTVICFEPVLSFEFNDNEAYNSYFLLKDIVPDHGKHWLVLKAYKNYREDAEKYLEEFKQYEKESLAEYEEAIKQNFDEVYEYIIQEEINEDIKELRIR